MYRSVRWKKKSLQGLLSLVLYFTIVTTQPLSAQFRLPFLQQYTDEDGLSNGFVTSIIQDSLGFLWFGTANGINRFDGYNFKTYGREQGLSHINVWCLEFDQEGALWIGTSVGLNRLDPRTDEIQTFYRDSLTENSLSNNDIETIRVAINGEIWVGTNRGLSIYNQETGHWKRLFRDRVRGLARDRDGQMWVGHLDTLYRIQPDLSDMQSFPLPPGDSVIDNRAMTIHIDEQGQIWVATVSNGCFQFNPAQEAFVRHWRHIPNDPNSLRTNTISAFADDPQGRLLIGNYGGGLHRIDPDRKTVERFVADSFNLAHQNMDIVRAIYTDRTNNVWLGTFYGGVKSLLHSQYPFRSYFPTPGRANWIRSSNLLITSNRKGKIWTWDRDHSELLLFDPEVEIFQAYATPKDYLGRNIRLEFSYLYYAPDDILWCLSTRDGLWQFAPNTRQWRKAASSKMLTEKWAYHLFPLNDDYLLISSQKGLFEFHIPSEKLRRVALTPYPSAENDRNQYVYSIRRGQDNALWVTTQAGVNRRSRGDSAFVHFPAGTGVIDLHEDQHGDLWMITFQGLLRWPNGKALKPAEAKLGLMKDHIGLRFLTDSLGVFWIPSNKGLYRIDPSSLETRLYTNQDGLVNKQYLNYYQGFSDGTIFLIGPKGVDRFNPENLAKNLHAPPTVITDLLLFNQTQPLAGSTADTLATFSPLNSNIAYLNTLDLNYRQNDISFEFAALDFTAPENNQYRYRLLGNQKGWSYTGADRRYAHFSNLSPGRYTFSVQGSNNDGVWGKETQLEIRIWPPWWWNGWSKFLYLLSFIILARILWKYDLNRRLVRRESLRLQELNADRSRLYANITHEFRTPLTIISGLTDQLSKQVSGHLKESLRIIKRNGKTLLILVNQMLVLSKLESGEIQLELVQGDIVAYLKYLMESFQSYAKTKQIRLHLLSDLPALEMDYDPTKLMHIVSNLVTNAIKFSARRQEVYISLDLITKGPVESEQLRIRVKDTGIGISKEKLPQIFDRFYQADNSTTRKEEGTGIGLTLTRELVRLMGGKISVSSELGKGSEFTVLLPVSRRQHTPAAQVVIPMIPDPLLPEAPLERKPHRSPDAARMLIVEDNQDLVKYLVDTFYLTYHLEIAYNGQQGIDKAVELMPDIIITDVMMPEKDGFELCTTLKKHRLTSHIPIIMLTAKADLASKLGGFQKGADAYLAKPFIQEELEVRVSSLLAERRRLQAYFRSQADIAERMEKPTHGADTSVAVDKRFLQQINEHLEANLDNSDFTVEALSKEVFMSPSNLFRKMKALTGLSPNQYIRSVRLSRARVLLSQSDLPIGTVAEKTGFSNHQYFSRLFRTETGMTPSTYRRAGKNTTDDA